MKQIFRKFLVLVSIVLMIGLLALSASAQETADTVVYLDSVSGNDANDGLTEATAVNTLDGAYAAVHAQMAAQGLTDDSAAVAKIVLVNDYTYVFSSTKKDISVSSSYAHTFQVVFTGKTPETALLFSITAQSYIGMIGPTTFENMTIAISEDATNQYLSIHSNGSPLIIGQGVSTSDTSTRRPTLSAAPYYNKSSDFYLEVNSGQWRTVYAGGYISTMTGRGHLVMNGGYAAKIAVNFNGTHNGNAIIEVNGGTIGEIMCASANSSGKVYGDVTTTLRGGTVTGQIDPDGLGNISGTSSVVLEPNGLSLLYAGDIPVNTVSEGTLTLGSTSHLVVSDSVTGTVAVTVDPTVRYNYVYVTAPADTADSAFTFHQVSMTTQTDTVKTWTNQDTSNGFTGLVLTAPSAYTVNLYPGVSGGSAITPDTTETVDGIRYAYYANITGTYRFVSSRSGYYTVTKVIYMSEVKSLTETVVDATTGKKAGTGYEPTNVKDYSDEMLLNVDSTETAAWWEDYSQYLTTPVFQEGRADHQATTQAEMEAYLADLDGDTDNMYIYSMGTSYKYGYNMPIVIFSATDLSGAETLEEAAALINANEKVTVHYQAQIHGNEPAAGEAALAVIGRLNSDWGDTLLENLNIYVIPRLNPDGSYLYQRNDANGVNMNRDMLLAQTHEVQQHHYVYGLFNPELAIDSHEYTYQPELASGSYNDMMIASGHNGQSGEAFVQYSEMIARLPFQALYDYEMQPAYYINVTNNKYTATGTSYRGMRGSVSILLESRGIGGGNNTMERRVAAHLIAMNEILTYAAEHSAELQAASDAERQRIANSGKTYEDTDVIVLEHAQTTDSTLNYTNKTYDLVTGKITVGPYTSTPKAYRAGLDGRTRTRPTAYVIPAGESWTQDVLDLMDIHDISYYFVPAGMSISLQQYTGTIEAASLTDEQYYTFESGCYVLPMDQANATILAILMEPDITDEYNVDAGGSTETVPSGTLAQMDMIPCQNEVFPIYRYVQDLNADSTVTTVVLPAAPKGLSAVKITEIGGTGSVTGFDTSRSYEYRSANESSYTALEAGTAELTGLYAGIYYVRYAAEGTTPASADAAIEIDYGVLSDYTVYVDSTNGDDTNDGYTEQSPVATIAQAYTQLDSLIANAPDGISGTVMLLADYNLGATAFTFPSHDYHVIFTAKEASIALIKGGTTTQTTCTINLSGDTTFQNLTLKIASTGAYNNFNANGHNVTMGKGLTCAAGSKGKYFMLAGGGWNEVTSTNLTVESGTWEYIYIGGYTGSVSGDANLTVTGGTVVTAIMASYTGAISGDVNISLSGVTVPTVYCGFANTTKKLYGNVTVQLGEDIAITTLYAGSRDAGEIVGVITIVENGADMSSFTLVPSAKTAGATGGCILSNSDGSVLKLLSDVTAEYTLSGIVLVDLAGFDFTNAVIAGNVSGMDSATDSYTDAEAGTLTYTLSEGGILQAHCRTTEAQAGSVKRYLAVANADGSYSFHRFYVGITRLTLRPTTGSVGYKAVFAGSDTVKAQLDSFGYNLWISENRVITASYGADQFTSLDTVTLRIDNFISSDLSTAENITRANTAVHANVYIKLSSGEVITSTVCSYSMRDMVELVNTNFASYSATQQASLVEFVTAYSDVMKDWEIGNIA